MTNDARRGWRRLLIPPSASDFLKEQRLRFLHFTLLLSFLGALIIGCVNLALGAVNASIVIFSVSLYAVIGLWLNATGRYTLSATLLILVSLAAINYNLYDGAALHDPATAGLLLLIVLAAMLFDSPWILVAGLLAVLSVIGVFLAVRAGLFFPELPPTPARVYTLSTVYMLATFSLWLFSNSWQRAIMHLQESYDRTLEGWVKALELKDPATSGHSQRGVELTIALGRRLGMREEDLPHLRRGALLHDIGKIAVPDSILAKAGPLDAGEWEIMRRHPAYARNMLSGIRYLRPAIDIPYSHHEAWDGSGYPQGLKGEQIPLAARIFTVIDHWEALREDRPYRPAWPEERVLAHLTANAGVLFDPRIVQAFFDLKAEEPDLFSQ